ncbi:putative ankyrin-repeat protein [Cystobasidiomycetes sp. EMM_F5]
MTSVDVHRAAREGQSHLVGRALADNPELLNVKDADARTPLANASTSGSLETVQAILHHKPDVEARDSLGWTPLMIAVLASAGATDIVTELVGAGASVIAENDKGITVLHYAASRGRLEIGRLLIERGADINARDSASQLPLHRAATVGATPFIKLILASESTGSVKKPRLNLQDRAGNTPLHLATVRRTRQE